MMLKKIKKLDVEATALIEIVENEQKQQFILKTMSNTHDVLMEKRFIEILTENNLSHLNVYENESLKRNQLLLEYIKDSPTLGKNETLLWIEKWARLIKKIHNIRSRKSKKILTTGKFENILWKDFLKDRYRIALKRNKEKELFDEKIFEKMHLVLEKICGFKLQNPRLIHGDLHTNNALLRDNEIVIFDKGQEVFFGEPAYDLAIVLISFGFSDVKDDQEKVKAFIKGYGKKYFISNTQKIELYTLFRAFERAGNKFEPQAKNIVCKLLKKI